MVYSFSNWEIITHWIKYKQVVIEGLCMRLYFLCSNILSPNTESFPFPKSGKGWNLQDKKIFNHIISSQYLLLLLDCFTLSFVSISIFSEICRKCCYIVLKCKFLNCDILSFYNFCIYENIANISGLTVFKRCRHLYIMLIVKNFLVLYTSILIFFWNAISLLYSTSVQIHINHTILLHYAFAHFKQMILQQNKFISECLWIS